MTKFVFIFAFVLFILQSVVLNKHEIWFCNMDQDSQMLIGAMDVNAGRKPPYSEHPALGTYFVYGIFLRAFSKLAIVEASDSDQLYLHKDPLSALPDIYYSGRIISMMIAILCAIIFGSVIFLATRDVYLFLVGTVLALFSCGTIFQSLVIRTELTSVLFALISVAIAIFSFHCKHRIISLFMIFLSGLFVGFAMVTKVQILPILFLIPVIIFEYSKQKTGYSTTNYTGFVYFFFLGFGIFVLTHIASLLPDGKTYSMFVVFGCVAFLLLLLRFKSNAKNVGRIIFLIYIFVLGALLSHIVVLNVFNYDLSSKKMLTEQILFPWRITNGGLVNIDLNTIITNGLNYFQFYLRFSLTFYMTVILLLFSKRKRYSIFLLVLWVAYIVFNSFRSVTSYNWVAYIVSNSFLSATSYNAAVDARYLIYSDLFLNAAFLTSIYQFLKNDAVIEKIVLKTNLSTTRLRNLMIVLILINGFLMFDFTKSYYPKYNLAYRYRIDLAPFCIYSNKAFNEMLLARYGSNYNVYLRIYSDPDLNGKNRGIDIMEIPLCKLFYNKIKRSRPEQFRRDL